MCICAYVILWYNAIYCLLTQVWGPCNELRQNQVQDVLRHSGSDPKTLRMIDATVQRINELFCSSRRWMLRRHRSATRRSARCWVSYWVSGATTSRSGDAIRSERFAKCTLSTRSANRWRRWSDATAATRSASSPKAQPRYCLASLWRHLLTYFIIMVLALR